MCDQLTIGFHHSIEERIGKLQKNLVDDTRRKFLLGLIRNVCSDSQKNANIELR